MIDLSQVRLSDLYVSMNQAASILWVNEATIRRWVRDGKLRGEKIGRVTLIPKQDVLAMALQRGIKQESEAQADGTRNQDGRIGQCQNGTPKPSSRWAAQS